MFAICILAARILMIRITKHLHGHRQRAPLLDMIYRIFVQAPKKVDVPNIDIHYDLYLSYKVFVQAPAKGAAP